MKRYGFPDYVLIFSLAILVLFGLVMLASASSNLGQARFGDSAYYLKHQLLYGFSFGLAGFLLAFKVSYLWYKKFAVILLIGTALLLFLVFSPLGFRAGAAERWLKIGPLVFQPAELLKITLVIYVAAWLAGNRDRLKSFSRGFVPLLLVIALLSGLLLKQPTTSITAILIAAVLIMYFASGAKLSYIVGLMLLGVLAVSLVIAVTPYRLSRVLNFLDPQANLEGGGYHLNQARIAIGSGNLFGTGYGQSTTKINYLPEPMGDSIFAVIAEELGFVGSIFLISLFILLVWRILMLSKKVSDPFARLVLIGFGSLIALQSFMNIAAISGLIPLTGVPLPFISYGGTALAVFMTMGGIVVNISKHSR